MTEHSFELAELETTFVVLFVKILIKWKVRKIGTCRAHRKRQVLKGDGRKHIQCCVLFAGSSITLAHIQNPDSYEMEIEQERSEFDNLIRRLIDIGPRIKSINSH